MDGPTDGLTDGPTERGVESRSTRLKKGTMGIRLPSCYPSSQLNYGGGNMDNLYYFVLKGNLNDWRNGNSSSRRYIMG